MAAPIRIVEFNDPACPFGYNAEPARKKLAWRYGDTIDWELRMVVLSESADEVAAKGLTTDRLAAFERQMAAEHGMPAAGEPRERLSASLPACRAIVAARIHAPGTERLLDRALRRRSFAELELLDDPETIAGAATDAGLDPAELEAWCATSKVEAALHADMAAARNPIPAALALDHKLAGPEGERRYTCPSLEIERIADRVKFAAPGFWPYQVYEALIANVQPYVELRPWAEHASEVLEWAAGEPLSTREVAGIRGISDDEAAAELAEIADESPYEVGSYWTVRAAVPAAA